MLREHTDATSVGGKPPFPQAPHRRKAMLNCRPRGMVTGWSSSYFHVWPAGWSHNKWYLKKSTAPGSSPQHQRALPVMDTACNQNIREHQNHPKSRSTAMNGHVQTNSTWDIKVFLQARIEPGASLLSDRFLDTWLRGGPYAKTIQNRACPMQQGIFRLPPQAGNQNVSSMFHVLSWHQKDHMSHASHYWNQISNQRSSFESLHWHFIQS